jgi:lipoprotein-anchoring transpeptidase ErfK/SrfK
MENEDIKNEGALPDTDKDASGHNTVNSDGNSMSDESSEQKDHRRKPISKIWRAIFVFLCLILITSFLIFFILYGAPVIVELSSKQNHKTENSVELKKDPVYKKQITLLTKDIQRLSIKFNAYTSGQSYIVINTTENRFFLYTNKKLVREGFCSTGSLTMLKTEKGDKFWVFKTPKGKRSIHGKITNPSWNRPDWSFIEEGLPVPPKNSAARYESGVLGDYALSIGDGYLIHGTIYKRFLGMPVTHGCVRLNDEDLEAVYHTLNIGSKVYIF